MSRDPLTPQQTSLWSRFVAFKTILVSLILVGLLASNVASLVSVSAHDWMHNALWRVLSIGGQVVADGVLAQSPKNSLDQAVKAKTAELDARNKHLSATNELLAKDLKAEKVKGQKLAQQLELNGKQAKKIVAGVGSRLAKGVTRNIASIPGEALPYVGIGVNLTVTSLDIYDACQTMKDFNSLLQMMGQGEEHPDVCGRQVPTVDQVVASVKSGWRSSVEVVEKEAKERKMPTPEVRLPTKVEVAKSTCSVVFIPYLCSEN